MGPAGAVVAVLLGLAVSCGSSGDGPGAGATAHAATAQIEDVLADGIGLGQLDATCDRPTDGRAGTPFSCSATTADDQVIEFTAELLETGTVTVRSTNLLSADDLPLLEREAAEALSAGSGTTLDDGSLRCPATTMLVVDVGTTLECELANPRSGVADPAAITITALDPIEFDVELG